MPARMKAWMAVFALMAAAIWPQPTPAASFLEKNFYLFGPRYDSVLPQCEAALGLIASRFAVTECRFWNSNLQLVDFADVRETALRPWADQTIPRRFCSARTKVSDGLWRPLHYVIVEDAGLIGASWGVEWCVAGLDRNWAYNPGCRMARP
jgi:hypothetical protein